MKALIFAAGLGQRMRPLTDHTPKPLLLVGGKPLVAWHLERVAALGVRDVVINTSWLAGQFPTTLGDGSRWGLRLHYSYEGATALETGGGMWHALSLLRDAGDGDDADAIANANAWSGDPGDAGLQAPIRNANAPFLAINGDIWCDCDLARLPRDPPGDAHLVLVDNPVQHPTGDFALDRDGSVRGDGDERLTFAGIGVYRPSLFDNWCAVIGHAPGAEQTPPRFKLPPLLLAAMATGRVTGEHHRGQWVDVGTPQRLADLDASLR